MCLEALLPFDVISLGYSAVDYIGVVPRLPEIDTKILMEDFTRQGGGPAATAAVTVARLGGKSAFVGVMGDDDFSEFMLAELAKEGVDTSHALRCLGASSQFSFIMVDKSTGKRTIVWTRSDLPPLRPDQLDRDFISSCKVLHLDRHEPQAGIAAAKWVHEAGGIVSMDAGTYVPELQGLLPYVDVLIASHKFAHDATGETDPAESALALLGNRRIAGVTCGDTGSWFATSDGGRFHVPAFQVDVVDTNGAGDVFHGAFAFGLAQGWEAEHCARFASAVAALKCTKLGGRAGIPSRQEAEKLLKEGNQPL